MGKCNTCKNMSLGEFALIVFLITIWLIIFLFIIGINYTKTGWSYWIGFAVLILLSWAVCTFLGRLIEFRPCHRYSVSVLIVIVAIFFMVLSLRNLVW